MSADTDQPSHSWRAYAALAVMVLGAVTLFSVWSPA